MKRSIVFALAIILLGACSTKEIDFQTPIQDDVMYFTSFEQPSEGTKVYANEDLLLRWNADDRVSIFEKKTYNQQFRFTGETGDNAGGFKKVEGDDYYTGNAIQNVVSVYPYQESTKITESEVLTVTLPAEQTYAENSFGLGANTMVSVTSDNYLQYKNVGGYLMLKLYGNNVTVKSITLKGNNGEKIAGKGTVSMPVNGTPALTMTDDATEQITLACPGYVTLGTSAMGCTEFWFVVPPVTFTKGFTVMVTVANGSTFTKSISSEQTITRSNVKKMAALEVEIPGPNLNYLAFTALEDGSTIALKNKDNTPNVEYSMDRENWTTWDYSAISLNEGETVYMRGNNENGFSHYCNYYVSHFVMTGKIAAGGNIMSLVYYNDLTRNIIPSHYCFYGLFNSCTALISAPELPATTLDDFCYESMFSGCTGLTAAPELPATTLNFFCYAYMFSGCTGLTAAPVLPATTLTSYCYSGMFGGCTGLRTAPELPATTLSYQCYSSMFANCTGLRTAPELPAITLAQNCYESMFSRCTGLTEAPALPATTLANFCYEYMFSYCSSLTTAPELPATKLASYCYAWMFSDCYGLSNAPALPATTLADNCYYGMFQCCTSLTAAPELPAKWLKDWCYGSMFAGCSSLTTAPELPATTLKEKCYMDLFNGCANLQFIRMMATDISAYYCLGEWVSGVASKGTFIKNPEATWDVTGVSGIPEGWTVVLNGTPEAVDLGLSVKWASFNLGASKPEEYGEYYAWGEIEPYYRSKDPLTWKDDYENGYDWPSYKWCMGNYDTLTKYCNKSSHGYNGFTDTKTVLDTEDDAANANLGGNWRMPTAAEWTELRENCTWTWTTQNGVNGMLVTASNGNSLFLPSAGVWADTNLYDVGDEGNYWSSSLYTGSPRYAGKLRFNSVNIYDGYNDNRCYGYSVRPVCEK